MSLYLEVRLYRWAADDGTFPETPGRIDARVVEFENLANASAVYDDLAAAIELLESKGVHKMSERHKPGRKRRNDIDVTV